MVLAFIIGFLLGMALMCMVMIYYIQRMMRNPFVAAMQKSAKRVNTHLETIQSEIKSIQ